MYSVKLAWHEHNLDLPAVDSYVRANFPNCVGNSADTALTFWFTEALTEEQEADLEAYWNSCTAESDEAVSYVSNETIQEASNSMRAGLVAKTWDSMSAVERKMVLGMSLTKAELGL